MKINIYYIILFILIVSCTKKERNISKVQEGIQMIASFNKKDTVLAIEYVNKTDTNYYFIGSRFSFVDKRNSGYLINSVLNRNFNKLKKYQAFSGFYKIDGQYDSLNMVLLNKKIDSIYPSRCNYVPKNKYGMGNDSILICLFEGICLKKNSKITLYYKFNYDGGKLNNQLEYALRSEMFRLPVQKDRLSLFENINLKGYYPYKRDISIKDTLIVKYK